MAELASPLLAAWESFYVIVGSSGGALIGLQFVVMTLIAERRPITSADSISAFGTSTLVHLGGALVVSALMSAPWPSMWPLSIVLGACGALGLIYSAFVTLRARHQTAYKTVLEDWVWFLILPCLAYGFLTLAAVILSTETLLALFIVGAVALSLLLIGIHNAWDTVTYIVISVPHHESKKR